MAVLIALISLQARIFGLSLILVTGNSSVVAYLKKTSEKYYPYFYVSWHGRYFLLAELYAVEISVSYTLGIRKTGGSVELWGSNDPD